MRRDFLKTVLPLALCCSLSLDAARAQNVPARINVVVVEGEGASTTVRQRVSHDPVVQVEDDDHRPVAGAVVVFALPVSGPSGEFANGARNLTVITDDNGRAAARGLKTNDIPGKLQIYVTVSYRGLRARGLVNQMVLDASGAKTAAPEYRAAKSGGGKWKWVLLGIAAGGGAGAGYYFATHSSNSPISINTGAAVFGSPR
jgi:hypothetical protein